MFAHIRTRFAATGRQGTASIRRRLDTLAALCLTGLLTAACSSIPPSPFTGPDPANPRVRVPAVAYRSTVGPYASQRPVEPRPWREQNQGVAPAPKP